MFTVQVSHSFDDNVLWLPINFQHEFLNLKKAAKSAESLERCKKVIQGTIDLNQSISKHPIYRIQCKQENKRTYNEMVDGLSFKPLTTTKPDPNKLREKFIALCLNQLERETPLLKNKVLLDSNPEAIVLSSESATFHFDFNAKGDGATDLKYRAICNVSDDANIKIVGRKYKSTNNMREKATM